MRAECLALSKTLTAPSLGTQDVTEEGAEASKKQKMGEKGCDISSSECGTAITRPARAWACQQPIVNQGGAHGGLPLIAQLLATDGI